MSGNSRLNIGFFKRLKPQVYSDSQSYNSEIVLISINPVGNNVVNSRTDGSLRIWRSSSDRLSDSKTIDKPHERPVESVSWNPKTEYTFATVGKDKNIKIWRAIASTPDKIITVEKNDNTLVVLKLVKYSTNGDLLAVVDKDSTVLIYSTKDYKKLCEIKLHEYIYSFEWFNGGDLFIVGFHDGSSHIYKYQTGEITLKKQLKGHKSSINSTAIDPRGTYIFIGSNEGVASFWSTATLLPEKVITDVDESISCVACSRDGTYVGVCYDGDIPLKIYDASTTEMMLEISNAKPGKQVAPSIQWFPNKTAFIYTSDDCKTMTYMIKSD